LEAFAFPFGAFVDLVFVVLVALLAFDVFVSFVVVLLLLAAACDWAAAVAFLFTRPVKWLRRLFCS
jgi:hypothetical protein